MILYILRYTFYKILCTIKILDSLITLNITWNIVVHCRNQRVGQPMADSKVVQKSAQNLKIMWSAVQFFWPSWHVGWDSTKSLTYTNIILYIKIMFIIIHISII